MQPILETLAKHLIATSGDHPGEMRIILPNRRAGLFLQRHLAEHAQQVQWSPRIYAINDFINEMSHLRMADPVEVLFTLYDLYKEMADPPDPFDEFYFWGEMMLRDFDELDKYLVDAGMLFSNIIDLKQLEEPMAGLDAGQIRFIRQFWEGFHEGEYTREKNQFIEGWKRLPRLYHGIRRELESRGEGYQGMQYREIADRIVNGEMDDPGAARTIIAGFNALNGCEKKIFSWLKSRGAEIYWDYDQRYTADETSEAGRFLRENMRLFPPHSEIEDFRGLAAPKEIRIFELPTDLLQAKTVHRILEQEEPASTRDCTHTALVLCDEELLMPVIMSLPHAVEEINVTMGYPMKNTPAFSFIDGLLRIQHNIRVNKEGMEQFYHKDVTSILVHPYMRNLGGNEGPSRLEEITRGNMIMVDRHFFRGDLERRIFRKVESARGLLEYLRDVFQQILENLSGQPDRMHRELDREFIFQLLIHLNKLESMVETRPEITTQMLERLFRKMLSVLRVPFEGEPLSGLQVMGILETRLLDFKHVIMLSMNEDVMPAAHAPQSYIPYSLRIAFRMPAKEDMDAIYAYYFHRLLQRAGRIDLLYNGGSEGVRTGEMSRYLYQMIYEQGIPVTRPGMEVMAREVPALVVPHSREVAALMERYSVTGNGEKYLSPSAINTYIDCSLKFYLRYLAGIGEPDEVKEEIDAAGFGTVVHDAIRILYGEIAHRNQGIIGVRELEEAISSGRYESLLREVFLDYHYKGRKRVSIEGRNIIVFRVMVKYLEKIIRTDLPVAPFALVSAEQTYLRNLTVTVGGRTKEIRLGGKIDRVDRVGGTLRVIDYKTGDARMGFSSVGSLFDSSLVSRNGAALQTLFYAWLTAPGFPGENIMPGLYVMKALYGDDFSPALTVGPPHQRQRIESFASLEEEYLGFLKETVGSMLNPDLSFVQTSNEQTCRVCDFSSICNRTVID